MAETKARRRPARQFEEADELEISIPLWIPIAGVVFGTVMVMVIVGIVFWFKARDKELQFHQDLRIRDMEHQQK